MSPFPILSTNRLLLRKFTDNDLHNIFYGLSHPDVIQYYGVSYDSLEASRNQLTFFHDLEKNGTGIWWAICDKDNKLFYGACGLNNLEKEHKKAELGFWILPEYWRKGIITEAVPLVCEYGFNVLSLHRIEAIIETENQNSLAVMHKLQFTHEGTMRECEIKNDKFINLAIYSKLSNR